MARIAFIPLSPSESLHGATDNNTRFFPLFSKSFGPYTAVSRPSFRQQSTFSSKPQSLLRRSSNGQPLQGPTSDTPRDEIRKMAFGDFAPICSNVPLPFCPLAGTSSVSQVSGQHGIQPVCYARVITLANTIIFEGAAAFVHIAALIMTVIMILHVRSKFTAVGRKEITSFFYIYMILTVFSLILDAGVVPPGAASLAYFVAVQIGLASALCLCLFINGFVGFQLYEDGTQFSVWLLRLCSFGWFIITGIVALLTFKGWAGLSPNHTAGLFVLMYIINGIFLVVYAVMQIILVTTTLQDRWPLGGIAFGIFFFVLGQVILYTLSPAICEAAAHYVDGLFFATVCNLLAVMMVYKFWDSITKEDLEFSVGMKVNNWEVKEFIPVSQDDSAYDDMSGRTSIAYGKSDYANSKEHIAISHVQYD